MAFNPADILIASVQKSGLSQCDSANRRKAWPDFQGRFRNIREPKMLRNFPLRHGLPPGLFLLGMPTILIGIPYL